MEQKQRQLGAQGDGIRFSRPWARSSVLAALVLLAAGLILAGCGGSDGGGTTGGSTEAGSTEAGGKEAGGKEAGGNPALAGAEETVERLTEVPTDIGVSTPLKEKPTGTVVFMRCSQPICQAQADGTKAAAEAMGMKYAETAPQGFTPESVGKSWTEGLEESPTIIVAPGTPTQLFEKQLKQADAEEIPVITWSVPDAPGTTTIFGDEETALLNAQAAEYIAAESDGEADTLYMNLAGGGVPAGLDGFKESYSSSCQGCKLTILEIGISEIGSPSVVSKVVSAVQKDPEIDWITGTFGDLYIGVPQALGSAGIEDIHAITLAGGSTIYEYVKAGQQDADLAANMEFFAFKAVDAGARILAGQDPEITPEDIPRQFLTKETLDFSPSEPWPDVPGFQEEFTALWNGE